MIVYKCDCCGAEIPKIKKKDIHGNEIEVADTGTLKCKEYDFSNLDEYTRGTHLCKACAKYLSAKIDYELLKVKSEALQGVKTK